MDDRHVAGGQRHAGIELRDRRLGIDAGGRTGAFDLGFPVDFEHRFEPGMPLYMGLSRGGCRIHLSEHFGDAAPGARIRIEVEDVRALCKALNAADYRHARPGCQDMGGGCTGMTINDPSGHRLELTATTGTAAQLEGYAAHAPELLARWQERKRA